VILLISTIFLVSGQTIRDKNDLAVNYSIASDEVSNKLDDSLDQYQDIADWGLVVCKNWRCWAQTFYPTLDVLSRVEILVQRLGNITSDIYIAIKSSRFSPNLAYKSITYDKVKVYPSEEWIEFDFENISIVPGEEYYLLCGTSGGDNTGNYYIWLASEEDVYKGNLWMQISSGQWSFWYSQRDACFKTYGYLNEPPNTPSCSYNRNEDSLVITSIDPNENKLRYGVDWENDRIADQWTDLAPSGTDVTIECNGRNGTVGVIAEDEFGAQSDWILVKSKSKPYINTPFLNFLQNHPHLFPLLRQLLEL